MDLSPELTSKRTSEDVATEPQPAIAGTQDIAIVDTVLPPPKRVRFNSHDQVRTFLAEPFYPRSSIAGIADGIIASTLVPNGIGEDHDATDGPTNTNATSILIDINNSPFPITTSPTDLSPLFAQPPLLPLTATTIDSISPTLLMTNPLVNSASSASTPQDPDSATATATDRDDPAPGNIDAQAAGLLSQPAGESDPLDRLFLDDSYDEEADEDWKEEDAESSSSSSSSNEISEEERRRREEGYEDEGADEEEEEEEGDGEDVDVVDWDMDDTEWFTGKERVMAIISKEERERLHREAGDKGFAKFIKEYVFEKGVPITKLLHVFDYPVSSPLTSKSPTSLTSQNPFQPARTPLLTSHLQLLPFLQVALSRFLRVRRKLDTVNTIEHVASLLRSAKNIMVLTGAGVSVSCGIPDFRSETGIYARLKDYQLEDPQSMFDIHYFRDCPEIFYSFAKEIFPSNFTPSPSHYFVKLLEDKGKLLRNYTQNIDTLEHKAGIKRVLNCHGSFATASCISCGYKCEGEDIKDDIFAQRVPPCPKCSKQALAAAAAATAAATSADSSLSYRPVALSSPLKRKTRENAGFFDSDDDDNSDDDSPTPIASIMKPDITFFGENLPPEFERHLAEDRDRVDLLIVMGSSLKVAPVSEMMAQIPHSVPQVLVNRTPITHLNFDVQLLGDSDIVVPELCRMVGWDLRHEKLPGGSSLSKEGISLATTEAQGDEVIVEENGETRKERRMWRYVAPGVYMFKGAVVDDKYLESLRSDQRDESVDRQQVGARSTMGVMAEEEDEDGQEEEEEEKEEEEEEKEEVPVVLQVAQYASGRVCEGRPSLAEAELPEAGTELNVGVVDVVVQELGAVKEL